MTFGFKAKDFGNSWSSFWRELRARSAFVRCVLFTSVHGLCCQRLGLTWQSTADCGARGLWERGCLSFLACWACARGKNGSRDTSFDWIESYKGNPIKSTVLN